MKTRPKELTGMAFIFAGIAASFPIQIIWLFNDSPLDPATILTKLTPLNWAIIALAISMVPLTLRASPLFRWLAPVFMFIVAWNNWLVATVQGNGWFSTFHVSTVGVFLIFAGVLASPACRRVFSDPRTRWWLTPPRKRISLAARLCPVMGGEMLSKIFDLSEGGAFITLDDAIWRASRSNISNGADKTLAVGTYCWLRFGLNEVSAITCTAEIVRKAEARGNYPGGIGVRFVNLTSKERKTLHDFLKSLNANSTAPVLALSQEKNAA